MDGGEKTGTVTKTERGNVVSILVTVDLGQRQLVAHPANGRRPTWTMTKIGIERIPRRLGH
eukprot:6538322-Pyramimonas_sp.AAC.1